MTSSVPSFVVVAADVLDECVPSTDHLRAAELFEAAHWSQAGLQPSVIGFDRIVGVLLGHMAGGGYQLIGHCAFYAGDRYCVRDGNKASVAASATSAVHVSWRKTELLATAPIPVMMAMSKATSRSIRRSDG